MVKIKVIVTGLNKYELIVFRLYKVVIYVKVRNK